MIFSKGQQRNLDEIAHGKGFTHFNDIDSLIRINQQQV